MKKLVALSLALMLVLMAGCSVGNKSTNTEDLLVSVKQMIKHVYSPQTVEEYNEEALLWTDKMKNGTHKEMFGQYPIDNLTENDLNRAIHFEFITSGEAEFQSDNLAKILTEFIVTNVETGQIIGIEINFTLDTEGSIIDLEIN